MKQKVVIIGHSYSSRLSLIRSISGLGCDIYVIVMVSHLARKSFFSKPIDCYSKYVKTFYYCQRRDDQALISLLMEKCTTPDSKTIIIPDSDDVVVTIDNNRKRLEKSFLFPRLTHSDDSILKWMDKTLQKRTAKELGLNVAEAIVLHIERGKYDLPSEIHYPCFCKPLATVYGGKGGMKKCCSDLDLHSTLQRIISERGATQDILLEDFIDIDVEYALVGFSNGKEVFIPGVIQFVKPSKKNKGIALSGKIIPVTGFEAIISLFKIIVLDVGFVGIFDIDFFSSKGTFYFCELNLRYGGSGYAYTKMGANLPALMVSFFNNDIAKGISEEVQGGNVFINEKMCYEDWNYGYLSTKEFLNIVSTQAIHFVYDEKDPIPGLIFRLMFYRTFLLKKLRSVIRMLSHDK